MKRRMIIALLIFIAPCLLKAQGKFLLKGKLGNEKDGAKIYLVYGADDKMKVDSAIVQDGRFSFAGRLTTPVTAKLDCVSPGDKVTFYLENGTIYVNSPDSLKHAVITGSTSNDDNNRLEAAVQAHYNRYYNGTKVDYTDKKWNGFYQERNMVYRKFISENPESYISLLHIDDAEGPNYDYDKIAPLFNMLSKKLRNSAEGKKMAEKIERSKHSRIGAIAPDFTLNDTSGVPVKLSSFRGRYVLLDFWASYCGPCRDESPLLVKSFHRYKDKNFTVLGISSDKTKDSWLKAIHDDHLTWTHVLCTPDNARKIRGDLYYVAGIPMNYLIDPSGTIIARGLRGEALDEKLSEVLK